MGNWQEDGQLGARRLELKELENPEMEGPLGPSGPHPIPEDLLQQLAGALPYLRMEAHEAAPSSMKQSLLVNPLHVEAKMASASAHRCTSMTLQCHPTHKTTPDSLEKSSSQAPQGFSEPNIPNHVTQPFATTS